VNATGGSITEEKASGSAQWVCCLSQNCIRDLNLYEPPYTEPYVRWCGRRALKPASPIGGVSARVAWARTFSRLAAILGAGQGVAHVATCRYGS
jgi:hypothetical protein